MPPPETYKSEIGSQSTMCQVHTGAYVSLLASVKTDYVYRLPPKKDCHVYTTRSIYHYAYARQTQVNWKKKQRTNKKRKKRNFRGIVASLPPERDVTWFFDGLQQYYERLPIHPPRHGLPANHAIDSWPWLSRFSVLGAPVPCLLFAIV